MLRILALMLLWFGVVSINGMSNALGEQATKPPNIVFFMIDDLGRNDVGFMGSKDYQTPNIDRLAEGGTILDAHYVQPVCSPTRAALMTGRYATRTGVYTIVRPKAKWGLPLSERTLANALKEAGYETAICGKWHLGEYQKEYRPTQRGFDHQYGHFYGALDYFTHKRDGDVDWYRNDQPLMEEGYTTHLLSKEACRLIRERKQDKPLFLYVPFNGVHAPMQSPEKYVEKYKHLKGNRALLGGMLAAVDEAIGEIVQALVDQRMRENTLIVFSSDNGGPNPVNLSNNGSLRAGKGTLYEGGIRVCAFANWPGQVPAGKVVREPMHVVDWYPTLVKLAGGNLQQAHPIDGKDVWPMIVDGAKTPHASILMVQSPTRAAVRMGDWKYLSLGTEDSNEEEASTPNRKKAKGAPEVALYHLASDPGESNNLLEREATRGAEMKAVLDAYLQQAVPPGNLAK